MRPLAQFQKLKDPGLTLKHIRDIAIARAEGKPIGQKEEGSRKCLSTLSKAFDSMTVMAGKFPDFTSRTISNTGDGRT